jgi:hypothetical protein
VVAVVVPARVVERTAGRRVGLAQVGDVAVILGDEVDVAAPAGSPDPAAELHEDVGLGVGVADLVHRVEAQAVEPVLRDPGEADVEGELAHLRDREGHGRAPGRGLALVEEVRRDAVEVRALGRDVVEDEVEDHHDPQPLRVLHEALEVLGRPVRGVGREQQAGVVAPAAPPREVPPRA